jgi:hypothetical protein
LFSGEVDYIILLGRYRSANNIKLSPSINKVKDFLSKLSFEQVVEFIKLRDDDKIIELIDDYLSVRELLLSSNNVKIKSLAQKSLIQVKQELTQFISFAEMEVLNSFP